MLICACKGDKTMIDKIIEIFFKKRTETKRLQRITFVSNKNREMPVLKRKVIKNENQLTELSKYFCNLKGLNVKERSRFTV